MGELVNLSDHRAEQERKICSPEAEQSLIAAILQVDQAYDLAAQHLRPEDFADAFYARVFQTMGRMAQAGKQIRFNTLILEHGDDMALNALDQRRHFIELSMSPIAKRPVDIRSYCDVIASRARQRRLFRIASQLVEDPLSSQKPISEIAADLNTLVGDISIPRGRGMRSLASVTATVLEQANEAYKAGGIAVGISTGLEELDAIVRGIKPQDVCILAGRPSMGKTACAISIGVNVARGGRRVGVFSLEMSAEQLTLRILAGETGIPTEVIQRGEIKESDWPRLVGAQQRLASYNMEIEERGALRISEIRAITSQHHKADPFDLIIIDYVQLLRPDRDRGSRVEDITEVSAGVKEMAKELNVPVIALAQLSRQVEQREDKRPVLSDLRDSGALEQDADQVVFVYRDEYYLSRSEPDARDKRRPDWEDRLERSRGVADLIVAKNRHGPIGEARVSFHAVRQRFENLQQGY